MPQLMASTLYAKSQGAVERPDHEGRFHRCYYCGSQCGNSVLQGPMEASIRGRVTSTAEGQEQEQPMVTVPQSNYACQGCKLSIRGSVTVPTPVRPISHVAVRDFSWIIAPDKDKRMSAMAHPARAGTQRMDRKSLRHACLTPPPVPFAIILSDLPLDLIYKTPANEGGKIVTVNLNGEIIKFDPNMLAERIDLAGFVTAAEASIREQLVHGMAPLARLHRIKMACESRYKNGKALWAQWEQVQHDPLSALAQWLLFDTDTLLTKYPNENETAEEPKKRGRPAKAS